MGLDQSGLLRALNRVPITSTLTFTRPANATAYAGGKVLADATSSATSLPFTNVCLKPGGYFWLEQLIFKDNCTNASGSAHPDFYLHFLNAAMATPINDGANMDLTYAQVQTIVGAAPIFGQSSIFSMNITAGEGVGSSGKRIIYCPGLDYPLKCASGSTSLYPIFECLNAWTPVTGEQFQIDLIGSCEGA